MESNGTNQLQVFRNAAGVEVRTVMRNGEPWFVAGDVCRALDIDPTATRRLDGDEVFTLRLAQGESARTSDTNIVNESGLYALIFGSRKPEARAFRRWVTHEVLPALRKHGVYATGAQPDGDALAAVLATALQREQERSAKLEAALRERQPWPHALRGGSERMLAAADTFVRTVADMMQAGELRVEQLGGAPMPDPDGYEDERYLYLRPAQTYERVRRRCEGNGADYPPTAKALYESLKAKQAIEPDARGGTATRVKHVHGQSRRLLWLRKRGEDGHNG